MKDNKVNYQVLARKYRPSGFGLLVGQEALVRTLSNAMKYGRIAHAFLLTGIRGIGKTTTARIIAKALNCTNLDVSAQIVEPCGVCPNCLACQHDKHPDIIEMDAASKTGVGDIREVIENANYLPILGKYKIYIIDEVHMLSNNAFNALLKTLEEPPAHVKFIFATTEIKKIPITILSRCQRFDLKRLSNESLMRHLEYVADKEQISVDEEALAIIANQAEGSVRDGLSLLDQAIAYSLQQEHRHVAANIMRNMLGIGSKAQVMNLLQLISNGHLPEAIDLFKTMYNDGIEVISVLEDLLEMVHFITSLKLLPNIAAASYLAENEKAIGQSLAGHLEMSYLTVLWQMLLKGLQEVRIAPNQLAAAEMILIRLCYSAGLPTPSELLKQLSGTMPPVVQPALQAPVIGSFKDLVQLLQSKDPFLHHYLVEDVHLAEFTPGRIKFRQSSVAPKDLASKLSNKLYELTGQRWSISVTDQGGSETLMEENKQDAAKCDTVKAVLENFSGAAIVDVRNKSSN